MLEYVLHKHSKHLKILFFGLISKRLLEKSSRRFLLYIEFTVIGIPLAMLSYRLQ
jgi:hypothetical protein